MKVLATLLLLTTSAFAQAPTPPQAPDIPTLQRTIQVLVQQRDMAWNNHANSEAKLLACTDEVAALKQQIETLKKSISDPKPNAK